jgi:hypothetical protein
MCTPGARALNTQFLKYFARLHSPLIKRERIFRVCRVRSLIRGADAVQELVYVHSLCGFPVLGRKIRVRSSFDKFGAVKSLCQQLVWPTRAAGCVDHKSLFTWLVVWSTRACVRVHKSLCTWLVVWSTSSRASCPQEFVYVAGCVVHNQSETLSSQSPECPQDRNFSQSPACPQAHRNFSQSSECLQRNVDFSLSPECPHQKAGISRSRQSVFSETWISHCRQSVFSETWISRCRKLAVSTGTQQKID